MTLEPMTLKRLVELCEPKLRDATSGDLSQARFPMADEEARAYLQGRADVLQWIIEMCGDAEAPKRGKVIRLKHITREMVRADSNTVFVFGDNMARTGYAGQAKEMRGEPNSIGVPTKWSPNKHWESYFNDNDWLNDKVSLAIHCAFRAMRGALDAGRNVFIPSDGLGTGLAELPRRAPRIHREIEERIAALERRYP